MAPINPIISYVFIILLLITENLCNNTTAKYNTMGAQEFQTRSSRLISFNTEENGDISVELAFNVPFITIPVKKSVDMAQGAIANLNVGAVLLAGAMAFGFAILIPAIVLFMSKKMTFGSSNSYSGYRSEDSRNVWDYLNVLDQALTENNIDTTSCMQRMICWTVKNSAQNIIKGQSSSSDKIIDGLATSQWLQEVVEGTAFHSALKNGLRRYTNCSDEYRQCDISEQSFKTLARNFINTITRRK